MRIIYEKPKNPNNKKHMKTKTSLPKFSSTLLTNCHYHANPYLMMKDTRVMSDNRQAGSLCLIRKLL